MRLRVRFFAFSIRFIADSMDLILILTFRIQIPGVSLWRDSKVVFEVSVRCTWFHMRVVVSMKQIIPFQSLIRFISVMKSDIFFFFKKSTVSFTSHRIQILRYILQISRIMMGSIEKQVFVITSSRQRVKSSYSDDNWKGKT